MWLSLNILTQTVDTAGIAPEELALRLTMATAEIDSIEGVNAHFESIIAARVISVVPHPGADKLTLVDLDSGDRKHRVVCGATNIAAGDIVPLALPGTRFSEDMVIQKTKIRGERSEGMLCSERELGLSDDHSGIMILPPDSKPGISLSRLYPHRADVRFEIDNKSITHRPDLWSHEGFAREIGALYGRPFRSMVDPGLLDNAPPSTNLKVRILSPEAAPRYSALEMSGIEIAESPDWLKAMVESIGMRPINNIVDITNFVMAELGEPMHAFDRKKLRGDEIIVRMAKKGEPLTTLDGSSFELNPEDIVIADSGGPIALAGVMGGGNSEIDDTTTDIVLEAANFNPVNIRKTAARYSHRTEAAIRFEKSLSPGLTVPALLRCYDLICRVIPGATARSGIIDAYPRSTEPIVIKTDTDFIRRRLGEEIDDERIIAILKSLDFAVTTKGTALAITVPHYRATRDISIPEDIVEEVGRIYGYDNIAASPPLVPCTAPAKNSARLFERKIKETLSGHAGMIEVSGYSFIGETLLDKLKINDDAELRLSNPLSREQDRLRRSLVPNIVQNIEENGRFNDEFRIYELGRVYLKKKRTSPDLAEERTMVTGAVYRKKPEGPLFYEAKSVVSLLMERMRVTGWRLLPSPENLPACAHPGRSIALMVGEEKAGDIYELHPDTLRAFDITGAAALFDIDLDRIRSAGTRDAAFIEIQKYPDVPFEVSVLADRKDHGRDICVIVEGVDPSLVSRVDVVSVYDGAPIPEGKKSVSLRAVFASKEKTLSPEEIGSLQKRTIDALASHGFQLR
ncbi:MAG: phenylalanine--tRNA ligase subunit beta [Spirochaetes bacterium]|nr:phenylalanine--tRNA ligase subunit beta [Spirochaetota bacterium]